MNQRLTATLLIFCSVLLLASCGGGTADISPANAVDPGQAQSQQPAAPDATLGKFALYLDRGSLVGGAELGGLRLELEETGEGSRLRLLAESAVSLRALYFSLEYDDTQYSPVSADASQALGGEALELPLLQDPGELHYGRVLVDPLAQEGYSGSGVIAELQFARHAFDPDDSIHGQPRVASLAPPAQKFELISTDEPGQNYMVMVPYQMPGDFDQNSQVNLADLTPLAVHFGKKAPFGVGSVETVVDGDANGEINIADISVIGANFQNTFTGLTAMHGDQAAYDGGSGQPIAEFAFGDAQGVSSEERLWFSVAFNDIDQSELVWTEFSGSEGGSVVTGKQSEPRAFESEGQRVMSLNAQVFPLQPQTGETVEIYVNGLDPDGIITEAVLGFGGDSVSEDITFEGEAQLFRFTHAFDSPGEYPVTVSFRSAPAAEPRAANLVKSVFSRSFNVTVQDPFGDPPLASLELDPAISANLGTQVELNAGLSSPAAGSSITNYEWDFNGDGIFDEEGEASATTFDPAATDVDLGHVVLRVTDDNGDQDTATLAYIYNTADAPTPEVLLEYEGPLQFSETSVQLSGLGGVVNGLGDKLGGLNAQFGNFRGQFSATDPDGVVTVYPFEPGTPLSIDISGEGDHLVEFQLLFAGAVLGSDSITVKLGARAIDLEVYPTTTTINAPIIFTATPESPELIDHYEFDFGDGNITNTASATTIHEYTVKQDYVATVTAFWTDGKQNTSAPVDVMCGFERTVELTKDASPALLNQELNFTADAEFPELVTEYTYDFGDGNTVTTADTTVPYTYTELGNFTARLAAVYSDGPTTLSDALPVNVQDPGQLVTEPLLEIASQQNDFPLLVEFTAENTKFKVGTDLLSFSINFGDGSSALNITDISQTVWHAYYEPGSYTVTLTVRDTDFEQNSDELMLDVVDPGGKFDYSVIGGTPNTFEVARIVPVRGANGAFAWSARAAGGSDGFASKQGLNDLYHLYYASVDAAGTAWGTPSKVAEAKGAEGHISAALLSGGPALAWYKYNSIDDPFPDDGDLLFSAGNADGTVWETPVVVLDAGDIGRYPALANVNGMPAIVSRLSTSETNGTGKYIRATAADGSAWGGLLDIGPDPTDEAFFSMMNVNDGGLKPALAMQIGTGGTLRLGYQVADDADGSGWTPADTVTFTNNDRGFGIDLQSWGGTPWIAYGDTQAGRIYFVAADDAAGSSWPGPEEFYAIDAPSGSAPASFSLGFSGEFPAVLVSLKGGTDGAPEPVYLVSAADLKGTSWSAPEIVGWTLDHHSVAFGRSELGGQLILFYDHLSAVGGAGPIRSGVRLQD